MTNNRLEQGGITPDLVTLNKDKLTTAGETRKGLDARTKQVMVLATEMLVGGALIAATTSEVQAGVPIEEGQDDPTETPEATPVPQSEVARRILARQAVMAEIMNAPVDQLAQIPTETPTPTPTREVPTATVTPTPTGEAEEIAQVPSASPTAGETLVAMAPMNLLESSMRNYPSMVEYTDALGNQVQLETNVSRVEPLMGINGTPLMPGIYMERPTNLDPAIGNETIALNGIEVDQAFAIGTVHVAWSGYGPMIYLSVPMREMAADGTVIESARVPHYGHFEFVIRGTGALIQAIDGEGQAVNLPSGINDQIPAAHNGESPNRAIVYNQETNTLTFPTANGVVEIQDGDLMGVSFVYNQAEIAPDMVEENGNRTPEMMINELMNGSNQTLEYSGENNNFQYYLYMFTPENQ